ncbi:MAG: UvrD-helicase domain-containing protein [Bacilli bacterium]|nr:UvrD-helicase domain-containing protein [Bacilli bacterium]
MFNILGFDLDETQVKAIKCNENAVLVSAGAGSGKTLTIMGKIKYLIENMNVKSSEILCISFTNEAVNSLKNKLLSIGYNIDVLTFHKLSLNIIGKNYSIVDENYLAYIIDEYFKSYVRYNKKNFNKLKRYLYTYRNDIFNTKEYKALTRTIETFIKLAKSNDYSINEIYVFYRKSFLLNRIILKFIIDIMLIYKRELESLKKIDFDDMIHLAKDKVKTSSINYKYIIIDEFQDTSLVRFNLIKEIIEKCNSKIFVVGDDWQSIYRFSGCNLDLFINFKDYFNNARYFTLEYTYRNSNELIYVTSNFIMKNKHQLRKSIKSNKNLKRPIKIIFNCNIYDLIESIDGDILIIGRNNKDIANINYGNKLTIHKSKGLECENVILVNSDNIPNKMKNEKIINKVLKEHDYILYEEERRLFYVALTRTKSNVYIMVNKKISPFVKELIHEYREYIEIKKY